MGSRWVHGERHLPRYRERSRHRTAQLPRRLCRTISKSCSWPLRVLSLGSYTTVKKRSVRLAVPHRHEEFQARGVEEPTRLRRTSKSVVAVMSTLPPKPKVHPSSKAAHIERDERRK